MKNLIIVRLCYYCVSVSNCHLVPLGNVSSGVIPLNCDYYACFRYIYQRQWYYIIIELR